MFWLRDVSSEYYLYISPAYEEIWGRPPEDLYHNPALMTESIHPDDRKEVLAAMEQLNTRRVFNGEYRIIRADGQVRWIHARVFPVLDEKDEVTRLTGIAEDITERKEAQTALLERERLRMALEKEQEISALRHKLMSTLSHEFRTPLTIVQAAVQMLEVYAERNDAEKHHQRLKVILQQVKQMTEMLDDMSLVVHGTSQYMKFKPQTVEIEQLCRDFIEEMQASIGANHRMAFITDGNVQTLQADPRLLGRILSNLLHNAVKYSPKGAEVRLQLHQEENCLVLRVSDKGIGIPPEEQTHVFEPFFRASNTGDVRGTGLGLRIVKDCVTLHGGSVTFESLPGKGTTFMVRLPLQPSAAAVG
jgi:PAS domain S-box-containing protein